MVYWFHGCDCRRVVPKNCFNTMTICTQLYDANATVKKKAKVIYNTNKYNLRKYTKLDQSIVT